MGLWNGIKSFLYKVDLLDSGSLLRVKGEPQFKTLLGGFISITMMLILIAAFYNKIIDTFDKVIIYSSSSNENADDPLPYTMSTFNSARFMFGVEVWHHNLNQGPRYFDIQLVNMLYSFGEPLNNPPSLLEPCTREHWSGFPEIQAAFDDLYMSYWKCLPKDTEYSLKGKYSSRDSQTLNVAVKKCTNNTQDPRPCAPQEQIDEYFANTTLNYFTIYFMNPLINPDAQEFISYYLQDTNYIMFTQSGGAEGLLYIQDYTITTDQSIFPTTEPVQEKGGIVLDFAIKNVYTPLTDMYANFIIFKSPTSISINRSYQKLDTVFSYIGGLFGTVLVFFFLVSAYNTYKFEVNLAGYLYRAERKKEAREENQREGSGKLQAQPIEKMEREYNFLHFLGQGFYYLLRLLGYRPDWKRLKCYHRVREEMVKQLDVLFLIKRINFLQKSLTFLFTPPQLKALHLTHQLTMADAIATRRNYKLKARLQQELQQHDKSPTHDNSSDSMAVNGGKAKKIQIIDFANGQMPQVYSSRKKKVDKVNFDDEDYSSADQSSQQQEQQSLFDEIAQVRAARYDELNGRIWMNIDVRLRNIIDGTPQNFHKQMINEISDQENSLQNVFKPKMLKVQTLMLDAPQDSRDKRPQTDRKSEPNPDLAKAVFSKLQSMRVEGHFDLGPQQFENISIEE